VRTLAITAMLFVAASLVGPVIFWAGLPNQFDAGTSSSFGTFASDLVFLIWPTQPLAVIEVNTGQFLAASVAVGANVLLFAALGVLAERMARRKFGLHLLYLVTACSVVLLALWGAGFDNAHLNMRALAIALMFYATPFLVMARTLA
jgi:hypothetical protein